MSDLASFVAATIRDKVVENQSSEIAQLQSQVNALQTERRELKDELHQYNPLRRVQVLSSDGTVQLQSELMVSNLNVEVDLFPQQDDWCLLLSQFLESSLAIDDQVAVNLRDLEIYTVRYVYCGITLTNYVCIRLQAPNSADDLKLKCFVGPVTHEQYRNLTGSVDFVPQQDDNVLDTVDCIERNVSLRSLEPLRDLTAKVVFDEGSCTCSSSFFFHHLRVPYVDQPQSNH